MQKLEINLGAIVANWQTLGANCFGAQASAVVKANAYGLGAEPVVKALYAAGCRTFFVAHPNEGATIRPFAPQATIYVLNGFAPEHFPYYLQHHLHAVLGAPHMLHAWQACVVNAPHLAGHYALHFDTGIHRLGFNWQDASTIAHMLTTPPAHVMSHLACSDDVNHPMNMQQLQRFHTVITQFPGIPTSLANSAGVLLGKDYCCDMIRPGSAIYGGHNTPNNLFQPVVKYSARILQIRDMAVGDSIGYGAAFVAQKPMKIAVLSIGYADGLPRHISLVGNAPAPLNLIVAGHKTPLVGRISMDLSAVDVSHIPQIDLDTAYWVELIGPHQSLCDFAKATGTITYEVLTRLSMRAERTFIN